MDFDKTCIDHCWEEEKVTAALWNVQNMVSMRYLLNKWMDFDKTYIDHCWEGEKSWLNFGNLDLISKVTAAL